MCVCNIWCKVSRLTKKCCCVVSKGVLAHCFLGSVSLVTVNVCLTLCTSFLLLHASVPASISSFIIHMEHLYSFENVVCFGRKTTFVKKIVGTVAADNVVYMSNNQMQMHIFSVQTYVLN